ncbi:MAG: hypothetical protein JWR61_5801 [Ferruginibacter sp.]|uniref:hypothetical protein n=1 Tax=Ferruginibacter sp. TaxID=1940288 RepID=UPI00265ACF5D|nr:hypothetical protein [Ferruginibacter sp.]MDB5280846.1 hypothetical protein [Ferruginibacter sp.]
MSAATEPVEGTEEKKDSIDTMLDSTREQFLTQMEQLRPSHEAFLKLQQIVDNFDSIASGAPVKARRTRSASGDRAPRGSRSDEFLAIVQSAGEDGITVSDAATQMDGINDNYLYRLAKKLVDDGVLRKEEKRYYIAGL